MSDRDHLQVVRAGFLPDDVRAAFNELDRDLVLVIRDGLKVLGIPEIDRAAIITAYNELRRQLHEATRRAHT